MPTYEYACKSCGRHLEVHQSFSDDPLTTCPTCEGPLRKVFGNIAIAFKGSGFYSTDNRSVAKGGGNNGASSETSGKEGASEGSESKGATAEAAKSDGSGSGAAPASGSAAGTGSGASTPKAAPSEKAKAAS
jgi:putative FmdB family regulatory protein